MRKYVTLGVPGSGKSTQAAMLAREFDLVRISPGDMFRWHVRHHTKIGARVRQAMAAGALVGDDLVEKLMRDRLAEHDWNFGFIIDGFPRNRPQAEFFTESYDIDAVIYLDLPDADVQRRVSSRRRCPGCGMDYAVVETRPEREDTCDICETELAAREDDTPQALAIRLRDYHEETDSVLALLSHKADVVVIDARCDPQAVQRHIRERLGLTSAGDTR